MLFTSMSAGMECALKRVAIGINSHAVARLAIASQPERESAYGVSFPWDACEAWQYRSVSIVRPCDTALSQVVRQRGLRVLPHCVLAILNMKHIGITQSNRTGAYYQYGTIDAVIRRTDNGASRWLVCQAIYSARRVSCTPGRAFSLCCRAGLYCPIVSDEHECSMKGRL